MLIPLSALSVDCNCEFFGELCGMLCDFIEDEIASTGNPAYDYFIGKILDYADKHGYDPIHGGCCLACCGVMDELFGDAANCIDLQTKKK